MIKHFDLVMQDNGLDWARKTDAIATEARLDGIYIVRTSLDAEAMTGPDVIADNKSLAQMECAFRSLKTRLDVRPVHVDNADRVRAHVFLCMLAWHVEWHLRRRLTPLLFEDDNRPPELSSCPCTASRRCSPTWPP